MLIFFFSSALSALHLYNEPKFMVIGNPVILEQSHAHNAPDLWDRGSLITTMCDGVLHCLFCFYCFSGVPAWRLM